MKVSFPPACSWLITMIWNKTTFVVCYSTYRIRSLKTNILKWSPLIHNQLNQLRGFSLQIIATVITYLDVWWEYGEKQQTAVNPTVVLAIYIRINLSHVRSYTNKRKKSNGFQFSLLVAIQSLKIQIRKDCENGLTNCCYNFWYHI